MSMQEETLHQKYGDKQKMIFKRKYKILLILPFLIIIWLVGWVMYISCGKK